MNLFPDTRPVPARWSKFPMAQNMDVVVKIPLVLEKSDGEAILGQIKIATVTQNFHHVKGVTKINTTPCTRTECAHCAAGIPQETISYVIVTQGETEYYTPLSKRMAEQVKQHFTLKHLQDGYMFVRIQTNDADNHVTMARDAVYSVVC